jgi:hypothetical protein
VVGATSSATAAAAAAGGGGVAAGSAAGSSPHPFLHLGFSAFGGGILSTRQKVLVLDLDETLIFACTTTAGMAVPPSFSEVVPTMTGATLYHVWERPHLQHFLSTVTRWYTVAIFTAASQAYADAIIDRIDRIRMLDGRRRIRRRLYRTECTSIPRRAEDGEAGTAADASALNGDGVASSASSGSAAGLLRRNPAVSGSRSSQANSNTSTSGVSGSSAMANGNSSSSRGPMVLSKDVSKLRVAMDSVVLVDNTPACLRINPENGLLCPSYYPPQNHLFQDASSSSSSGTGVGVGVGSEISGSKNRDGDDYLLQLLLLLEALAFVPDVRAILRFGMNLRRGKESER